MRILHITDSHGTVKSPEGRRDIFYVTFLKKLYELGFVCKKMKVDMVVHTGDLFHSAKVSNKFAGQVSEMIKAMGVPFYVVPGNHDIEGYTTSTIDQTTLGLLSKAGVVTLLDRDHPAFFEIEDNGETFTVALSGQEYYAHIDSGNNSDFDMQQDEADLNILAIHGYITNTPQHPDIRHTLASSISTDADIILTGHYHRQFEYNGPDFDVFNPGSMMRVEQTAYNKTHMPHYGILDISLDDTGGIVYKYQFHQFKVAEPSTTVFDYNNQYVQKHASITLEGFKTSIANTLTTMPPTTDISTLISKVCAQSNVPQNIQTLAFNRYARTIQNVPDEFEAPQGFIEGNSKMIKSVHIENFQSHEDTLVEFDQYLNIIIGESNNGKTSILRAIMWVIDNKPLGTDFIMAGKDDCKVRITYDDGTFIERGRTRKDTGYYKIRYIKGGGFDEQTYRGFTNAVPIEVANVHQMPMVNITKDIETHLNVLSQLDPPFLISESPQNKAAAIGRITGTHIIDAAVKDISKDIHSTSIALKEHKADLQAEEFALKSLPNYNILHQFTYNYEYLYKALVSRSDRLERVQENWSEQIKVRNQIVTNVSKASECQAIVALSPIVNDTKDRMDIYTTIRSCICDIERVGTDIATNELTLMRKKPFAQLAPVVSYLLTKVQNYMRLKKSYDDWQTTKSDIERYGQFLLDQDDLAVTLKQIIAHISERRSACINLEYNYSMYEFGAKQLKDAEAIKSSNEKQVTSINKQMALVSQDMLKYVLSQNVCPCCGQSVSTEEHAQHIVKYMEGNQCS